MPDSFPLLAEHAAAAATLEVDIGAVIENYRILKRQAANAECAAVVKANAYGLGMEKVAPALASAGCKIFFVAVPEEGVALRALLPNVEIGVFHGLQPGQENIFEEHQLTPVLNTMKQLECWGNFAAKKGRGRGAILHFDTGMLRLGFPWEDAKKITASNLLDNLEIKMVMSHLSCADTPEHPLNAKQLKRFRAVQERFSGVPASLANSFGVFLGEEYQCDILRPGCALYGVNPTPMQKNPMRPVVRLVSSFLQVSRIDSPQTVGYGATCALPEGAVIATVPVGYADGYLRALGNKGVCRVGEYTVPVIGRVSMDLITLEITHLPEFLQREGVEVELIGSHIGVDAVAEAAGTIGYEVLTRLGNRFRRVYKGGGKIT